MRIQHNIAALNSYRQLSGNNSALSKNLEKLSSGYKINRAGDDAAGLAISEKMRAQIKGLEAAQKNANDGISLVQTAEGALTEVHSMLNRMVYLASQSANGTYDNDVDRANLQEEVNSLLEEIDRISQSTNFNGLNLLDGSMDSGATLKTGGEQIDVPILQDKATDPTNQVGTKTVLHSDKVNAKGTSFEVDLHNTKITAVAGDSVKVDIGGTQLTISVADTADLDNGVLGAGEITGADLAKAIAGNFSNVHDGTINDVSGNGQAFTVNADGTKVTFSQTTPPTAAGEIVNADLKFDVTLQAGGGAADPTVTGPTAKTVTVTDSTNTDKAANAKFDLAGFSVDKAGKVTFGVAGKNYEIEITAAEVTAAAGAGDSLDKVAARKLVAAINLDKPTDNGTDNAGDFTASLDGDTGIKLTAANADKDVVDTANTLKTALAADITITGDAGYTNSGGTITVTAPTTLTTSFADGDGTNEATMTLDLTDFDVTAAGKFTFTIGGKNYDIEITAAEVAASGTTSLDKVATDKLVAAMNKDKITDNAAGDFTAAKTADTTITVTAANKAAVGDATLSGALGNNITAAEKATEAAQHATDPAAKTSTFTDHEVGATAPTVTFDLDGFDIDGPGTATFTIGGKDFDVDITQDDIDGGTLAATVAGKLVTAMNADKFNDADAGDFTANAAGSAITLTAANEAAFDDADLKTALGAAMTITAKAPATAAGGQTGTINVGTINNVQGNVANAGDLASTTFDLTADIVKDGQTITIGKETYTFQIGAESKATGDNVINLKDFEDGDANLLNAAKERLSQQANTVFTIGYDKATGKMSIHEKVGNTELLDDLQDVASFDKLVYANKASESKKGGALSLQVGDTSDDFNKVTLDIKDMSTKGLDIEGLSIATQTSASDAVDKIKAAINTVSSQRGALGAIQNRLEHTINNLGVQAENITAAESRIRDTDMAEEMMAYTKNNILVQAAQAMLAQANQVPQGVLQLLQ